MPICVGDRVQVSGGYDFEPRWLGGRPSVSGVVVKWVPGQNEAPGCVIRLDEVITTEGDVRGARETHTGRFLVLEPSPSSASQSRNRNRALSRTLRVAGERPDSVSAVSQPST